LECTYPAVDLALESCPCLLQMKKVAFALLCCTVLMVFAAPRATAQTQGDQCSAPTAAPAIGTGAVGSANGTSTCGVLITINPSGSTITTPGNGNPYDGSEDTLVGIQNNSGASLNSITLTSTTAIFGFDADGPCDTAYHSPQYSWCSIPGFTGYEGPDNTFIGISGNFESGTVSFTNPIPNGESTWFALEGAPSGVSGTILSPILSVTLTGLGAGNVTDTSNSSSPPPPPINCTEAGGGVAQSGVCSETDVTGTMVTLTETPGSTTAGLSTFGGWGGACASYGTMPTCNVTMSSAQNVTASFVAPALTFANLTFNPGTNVTQSALICNGLPYSPPIPCTTDPNASELTILIPTVTTQFSLTLVVTEFSDNGLCAPGGNPQNPTYACRFQSFFNFGTDANGNTIAPLSFPYLNGNSAQYLLYPTLTGPGTTIPPADYSGDLYLDIGLLNTSAASNLPSYWAGSPAPVVLDDPDSNEFPGVPYGTDCSTPMLLNGNPINPPIYCQFGENITTFYNPSASLNSTGGGKIPSNNNFGLVFLPTNVPNPGPSPIPTPLAPTIAGNCVGVSGCALNGTIITFTEGTGGTFAVSVTNAAYPPAILTQSGTLPSGLTFNPVTGLISGTPADGTAGNYPITLTATNSAGAPMLSYTLTVVPAGPLTITASSATMTYGAAVPAITPSGSGFVNGDTLASLTKQPTCTTTATSTSLPGTYTSTCSGAVDTNYSTINYVAGTVTVVGLDVSPLTVNFGSLYLDQIGVQFVTLKNTTNAPITITGVTLGGATPAVIMAASASVLRIYWCRRRRPSQRHCLRGRAV
jgi:hypothetical protein